MTLCGCGKPKSHGGMCSVRWAVRRANNGPTGIKAKEPAEGAPPMSEEAIARRLFGDLADDILLLRAHGHTVARFRDGFRVDRDVLSADQLRARATALRERPAKSCGALNRQGRNPERLPALDGAPASAGQEMKSKRSRPEHRTPPAGCDGPQDIIAERLARIEQRIDFLFTAVAEAVACRRDTLTEQAAGLEQLQASLRGVAPD